MTEVGCAVSSSRPNTTVPYTVYVVCHYSPIGNIEGEFSANVKAYGELDTYFKTTKSTLADFIIWFNDSNDPSPTFSNLLQPSPRP